jgi:type II secretory pathway pseudopilin PulG
MDRRRRQRGVLLVAAIVLLVVVSALVAAIAFVTATSGSSATDNLRSGQALFLAESGLEFETRRMARNVDWYRSTTDPTAASGPQVLGQGTFTSSSNFPATKLRRRVVAASTAICVYTIDRFPASGTIQIDDDISAGAEFVSYTGTTASSGTCGNLPAFTGIGRPATVGGITPPTGNHSRDDIAYPVTTLVDALAISATCVAPAQLRINDNSKFLNSGTISLDDGGANSEDISYTTSSRAGGVMTLKGLTRLLGAGCPAWAVGAPVRPQLANSTGGSGNDNEVLASAVGNVGSTQRTMSRVLQR